MRAGSAFTSPKRGGRGWVYGCGMTQPQAAPTVHVVLNAVEREVVRVADFWAAALHYRRAQRLEQYEVLVPEEGDGGFMLLIQGVPEREVRPRTGCISICTSTTPPPRSTDSSRIGATRISEGNLGDTIQWTTLTDPVGNEFCVARR